MIRRFLALAVLVFAASSLWADDPLVVVRITPQVVETDHSVSWEQPLTQTVAPGNPVVVNINAEGLAIRVTVTPFVRGEDFLLVVQGDIRQTNANSVSRSTNLQSLLVPPEVPIAYFPLGRAAPDAGRQMVVMIRAGRPHE